MRSVCKKIRYVSRGDAKRVATTVPGGQRPYLCPHCGAWHLSSKSKRQVKQLRKLR